MNFLWGQARAGRAKKELEQKTQKSQNQQPTANPKPNNFLGHTNLVPAQQGGADRNEPNRIQFRKHYQYIKQNFLLNQIVVQLIIKVKEQEQKQKW